MKSLNSIAHITKWLDPSRLTIDLQLAHYFIEYYIETLLMGVPSTLSKVKKREVENKIYQRFNSANLVIRDILEGNFAPTRTGKDHRLHTRISSLKSELRTLITYDGKQLTSLDVTACQPFLFTQLLNPEFYRKQNNGLSIPDLYPELYRIISITPYRRSLSTIIMSVTYPENPTVIGSQGNSFTNISWSEDFYEYLMQTEAQVFGVDNRVFITRSRTKKNVMFLLYSKDQYKHRTPVYKRFERLFPREAALIRFFDGLPGDNFLPILLQRFESALLLEKVGRAVSEQLPDAPLITVHDSFLTLPEYVSGVKSIMQNTIYSLTNIEPGIKIEPYLKETTMAQLQQTALDNLEVVLHSKITQRKSVKIQRRKPLISDVPEYNDTIILTKSFIKAQSKAARNR